MFFFLETVHHFLQREMCFAMSRPAAMRHVVILAALDRHLSQSEDVNL